MTLLYNISGRKKMRRSLRNNATPHEILLWSHLRNKQIGYRFRRQYSFGPFIVDFYCPEKKLAVELDGFQHLEQKDYDWRRTQYLNSLGVVVLRFWDGEVNTNMEGVVLKIQEYCESLQGTPPPTPSL